MLEKCSNMDEKWLKMGENDGFTAVFGLSELKTRPLPALKASKICSTK